MKLATLAAACVIAALLALPTLGWIADDRCLDAGGEVVRGGADRLCRFADGRLEPATLGFTPIGWTLAALAYAGAAGLLYRLAALLPARRE